MSVNKVTLLGRVGKDVEVKNLQNDKQVANLSIATSEKYKVGNEQKESTEWHNCVAWGQNAKFAGQYVSKGDLVYVEGKLKTESWDKDGETKYATKIWIETLQICAKKDNSKQGTSSTQGSSNGLKQPPAAKQTQQQNNADALPWDQ